MRSSKISSSSASKRTGSRRVGSTRTSRSPSPRSKLGRTKDKNNNKNSNNRNIDEPPLLSIQSLKSEKKKPWESLVSKDFIEELWMEKEESSAITTSRNMNTFTALRIRSLRKNNNNNTNDKYTPLTIIEGSDGKTISIKNPLTKKNTDFYTVDYLQNEEKRTKDSSSDANKSLDSSTISTTTTTNNNNNNSNNNQQKIFQRIAPDLFLDIWKGYYSKVITIGDRLSGKSHTLFGESVEKPSSAGMIPQFSAALFGFIEKDQNVNKATSWVVEVSGYTVRNNKIKDLLLPSQNYLIDDMDNKELVKLIDSTDGGVKYIYNNDATATHLIHLKRKFVNSYSDMLNVLEELYVGRLLDLTLNRGNPTTVVNIRLCRKGSQTNIGMSSMNLHTNESSKDMHVSSIDAMDEDVHSMITFVDVAAPAKNNKKKVTSLMKIAQKHISSNSQNDDGELILRNWNNRNRSNSSSNGNNRVEGRGQDEKNKSCEEDNINVDIPTPVNLATDDDNNSYKNNNNETAVNNNDLFTAKFLQDSLSGDSRIYMIGCIHPSKSEFPTSMKRIKMVSKYQGLKSNPIKLNTKRIHILQVLRNIIDRHESNHDNANSDGTNLNLNNVKNWFNYEAFHWDSHNLSEIEKVSCNNTEDEKDKKPSDGSILIDETDKSSTKNDGKKKIPLVNSMAQSKMRPLISLKERRRNKNLLVKDTAKDLDKVARDRYTRYFVFQCKDPLLSSNIQLEVSPGRLRFTGKHQKYYDDTGRQVVLEGLPKKGLGCEVLNLDGLMTIVKRHSHVNVLVNGKSIDLNVDKEVKVGDRVIIADRYFFLLEDGGNSKKTEGGDEKKKTKSSPSKRTAASSSTRRGRSPSPTKRTSPSKKLASATAKSSSKKVVAGSNNDELYADMLKESLKTRADQHFKNMEANVKYFSVHTFNNGDSSDDEDYLELPKDEIAKVTLKSTTAAKKKSPEKTKGSTLQKKSSSSSLRKRASSPKKDTAKTKKSASSKIASADQGASTINTTSKLDKLNDVITLIHEANNLAKSYGVHVIFQPHYFLPINANPRLWLEGSFSKEEMSHLDILILGLKIPGDSEIVSDLTSSIFCATTPIHFAEVVATLNGHQKSSNQNEEGDEQDNDKLFFEAFLTSMGYDAACAHHPGQMKIYTEHKQLRGQTVQLLSKNTSLIKDYEKMSKNLTVENKDLKDRLAKSISELTLDGIIAKVEMIEEHKMNRRLLKHKYESTMQKFYDVAQNATLRVEAQQEEMKQQDLMQKAEVDNLKGHIKDLERILQKTKDSLMKANSMRIDRFLSKRELIQEYENLLGRSRSKSPSRRSGSPRRRNMQNKNNMHEREVSFEGGEDLEKLSLIATLNEKDITIIELQKEVVHLRSTLESSNLISNATRALTPSPTQEDIDNIYMHTENAPLTFDKISDSSINSAVLANNIIETQPNNNGNEERSTDKLNEAVNVLGNPPSTDKKKKMTTVISRTTNIQPIKLGMPPNNVKIFSKNRTPQKNYNVISNNNKQFNDNDYKNYQQALQVVQSHKKKILQLEETIVNQRDKIEALEFENDELLNANNILKEQVASHLTKIQRISRTTVKSKELKEMLTYVSHMESMLENTVKEHQLLQKQMEEQSKMRIAKMSEDAEYGYDVKISRMSISNNDNNNTTTTTTTNSNVNAKIKRAKSNRKKILENTSKRMKKKNAIKRKNNNNRVKRSSIDLSESYSSRSAMFEDDNESTNSSSTNRTSEKKRRSKEDEQEEEQRQKLWTKLWAWKEQRDQEMQTASYNNESQQQQLNSREGRSNDGSVEID